MRQSIFRKFIITTCAVVLVCFTAISVLLTLYYNKYLAQDKFKSLTAACESVSDFIDQASKDTKFTSPDRGLYYVMNNIARVSDMNVFIADSQGVIRNCVCSEKIVTGRCNHVGTEIEKKYIDKALAGGKMLSSMGLYKSAHYISVKELSNNGEKVGFVFATASAIGTEMLIKRAAKIYLLASIVPIILLVLALYYSTYRFTRPLKLMSEAAKSMANGDFSKRIPIRSDDEVGELALSFNEMADSLARLEETRKDFVANVSHELRTPMTTIGGFIDGINDGTIEKEKHSYYLSLVSEEVKRLSRMIESMLNISRLESKEFSLKYEKFDLKEMIINIVISQEKRIEEMEYSVEGLDELPDITVNADRDLIYRAIYNLVDNAVKFTDKGGKISFFLKTEGKNVSFKISNTGKGIRKADLPYVFERFYKGDKSRSIVKNSTGLGLYLVKTIIKNHGGSIKVSSIENELTTFEFTLPIGG